MSHFRVQKPLSQSNAKKASDLQKFTNDAETHSINKEQIDISAKPTRSFTVPLNEYELGLLQQLAKKLDRSQRYMARKLLVKMLEDELNITN
jgi:hypothetical protein